MQETHAEDEGLVPGSGRSPGAGNDNPLQYLTWEIQYTEESGGLQSVGSQRVGHDLVTKQQHVGINSSVEMIYHFFSGVGFP